MFKMNTKQAWGFLRNQLSSATPKVLASAKAVVAFIVGWVVAWLVARGIDVDQATIVSLENALYGLFVAVWVWFVPNK